MTNPRAAVRKLDPAIMPIIRIGGLPELTMEDVALACSTLTREEFLFVRYVWQKVPGNLPELTRLALLAAVEMKDVRSRHSQMPPEMRKGALQAMIHAALDEHKESSLCRSCNGKGKATIDHRPITCDRCDGRGTRPRSGRHRARILGKDSGAYIRYWRDTYEAIYLMFGSWEQEIYRKMGKRFGY